MFCLSSRISTATGLFHSGQTAKSKVELLPGLSFIRLTNNMARPCGLEGCWFYITTNVKSYGVGLKSTPEVIYTRMVHSIAYNEKVYCK